MKKWISILMLICATYGFAKSDTVYVDHHKVTYVKTPIHVIEAESPLPDSIFKQTFKNRISANIEILSLDFVFSYERLFSQKTSALLQLSYRNMKESDIKAKDDTKGTLTAFELGIGGKYFIINTLNEMKTINASGTVSEKKYHTELFIQAILHPTFAEVNFSRMPSETYEELTLNENEFALSSTLGMGFSFVWNHFFVTFSTSCKKYIVQPRWQTDVSYYKDDHFEHPLLDKVALISSLGIGWAF